VLPEPMTDVLPLRLFPEEILCRLSCPDLYERKIRLDNYSYVCINRDMKTEPSAPCTADRLLDAAEKLFAKHGFDGVGMRQLADEAKVNLGAATYHFGSKETLFIETFMRRFRPMNAERLRLLQAAENDQPLTVEKIVECMVRPPFESGLNYPAFHTFLASNLFNPPPFLDAAVDQELAPGAEMFIQAFQRALPELPEDLIHLRTMLGMGGLLMFFVRAEEIPGMQNKKIHEPMLREVVRFIAAGLQSKPALDPGKRPALPIPSKPSRKKQP